MQKGWLAKAGPYKIAHVRCPDYAGDVDLSAKPKGVLHTTEGGWDGSLAVFRKHYAPHFLVGPGRVAQLLPLGRAAAALERPSIAPTNGVVRAQIEVVGYSRHVSWLPDAKTTDALAWLMAELDRCAGIPLRRAPIDGRNALQFARASGWLGHADVPGNSHWDPGALDYIGLLKRAQSKLAGAGLRSRTGFYAWLAWYLGEGDWKPYGARNPLVRPNVPKRVPRAWWTRELAFLARRET